MDSLLNAIGKLKNVVRVPLEEVSEEELNSFLTDEDSYDPSEHFRKRLLESYPGARIKKLYACYYQGWECDEWAADIEKDGKVFLVETSHGGFYTNEGN